MIICVVGRLRSGKSVITGTIAEATEYPVVEVSDIVKRIAGVKVKPTDKSVREKLQLEKDKHKDNKDWLYSEIKKEVESLDPGCPPNIIVSGIREVYLLQQLEKDFGELLVIGIMISDKIRMQRAKEMDGHTEEQFLKDEERDVKIGIVEVMKEVDFWIDTERPLEETKKSIKTLFSKI